MNFTKEQELQICRMYSEEKLSTVYIGKYFNCGHKVIAKVLEKHNIPRVGNGRRKYFFDEHYFDIIDTPNKAYILECATAFAAFPYIRDWICQYLMWDFSNGKFPKPHIPLFSWEELGKIDSSLCMFMQQFAFR